MSENTKAFTCAATSLVDKEGYAVKATAGLVELSAASAAAIGVVRVGAAAGGTVDVALPGSIVPCLLAGTVTKGSHVAVDSNSKFAASVPTAADIVMGTALEGGVAGDLIDVLLCQAHVASA